MIFIGRPNDNCDCTPAPGLPIRPGLSTPTDETATLNAAGRVELRFGTFDRAADALRDYRVTITDLHGIPISDTHTDYDIDAPHEAGAYKSRLLLNIGMTIGEGVFQIVVTLNDTIVYSCWLRGFRR